MIANQIIFKNTELSPSRPLHLCVHDVFKICFKTTADSSIQWQYSIEFSIEFLLLIFILKK